MRKIFNINKINVSCGLSRDIIQAVQYAEEKIGKQAGKIEKFFEFIYRYKGKFTDESLNTWFLNLLQDIGYMDYLNKNANKAIAQNEYYPYIYSFQWGNENVS